MSAKLMNNICAAALLAKNAIAPTMPAPTATAMIRHGVCGSKRIAGSLSAWRQTIRVRHVTMNTDKQAR
jgi:hypothetical protein